MRGGKTVESIVKMGNINVLTGTNRDQKELQTQELIHLISNREPDSPTA